MTFLKPSELRHTLKISRSTEHRLLKHGHAQHRRGTLADGMTQRRQWMVPHPCSPTQHVQKNAGPR